MSREAEALRPIFSDLVVRLQPDDIIDKLYETQLLTQAEYEGLMEGISQKSDLRGVNRRILMAVSKRPEGSVVKFARIVKTSQPDLAAEILRAHFATDTARFPARHHSISTSAVVTPTKEAVAMQRFHDDDDNDVTPCPPVSLPNQPIPGTDDTAAASMSQPNPPTEDRIGNLQRELKEATSHIERQLKKAISHVEELSSRIQEQSSYMERLSLQIDALSSKTEPKVFRSAPLLHDSLTLLPEKLPDLPIDTACATAVIIERKMYICGGRCDNAESGCQVYVYNLNAKTWSILSEPAPQYRCEVIVINNQLVFIGGREASSHKITNIVSTWTGQRWQQSIPAMPSKRIRPGVIMYDKHIIVAGGMSDNNRALLSSIDILDNSRLQWWTPANFHLPQPMYALNITICSGHMYVAAAIIDYDITNKMKVPSDKAWQLPVSVLEEVLTVKKNSSLQQYQWKEIAPTPKDHSTLLKSSIHPIAVGGSEVGDRSGSNSIRNISVYDPIRDKWSTVGQLLEPRARCSVVCVSESSFLVCGGYSDTFTNPQPRLRSIELLSYHRN